MKKQTLFGFSYEFFIAKKCHLTKVIETRRPRNSSLAHLNTSPNPKASQRTAKLSPLKAKRFHTTLKKKLNL